MVNLSPLGDTTQEASTSISGGKFTCYISEKINYYAAMNCKVMGIGIGNINKKQYENFMEDYHKMVETPKNKTTKGKAAIYTGIASTIGAGLLIGLKIWSKKDKK